MDLAEMQLLRVTARVGKNIGIQSNEDKLPL